MVFGLAGSPACLPLLASVVSTTQAFSEYSDIKSIFLFLNSGVCQAREVESLMTFSLPNLLPRIQDGNVSTTLLGQNMTVPPFPGQARQFFSPFFLCLRIGNTLMPFPPDYCFIIAPRHFSRPVSAGLHCGVGLNVSNPQISSRLCHLLFST